MGPPLEWAAQDLAVLSWADSLEGMSVSVQFPAKLLSDLDELAQKSGVKRNRLIIEACEEAVKKRRTWPEALFDESRFAQLRTRHL